MRWLPLPIVARVILHVDMDAFYAAVEMQKDPSLAGRPVVIGADPKGGKGRGVVSTANYEARTFGIHSAMPIAVAYRACPHARFLVPDGKAYRAASQQVMEILAEYADCLQVVGLDEAYLDVTAATGHGVPARIRGLCHSLQARVLRVTGLTCSIGAGPSKSVAKIASDYRKPRGITIVAPERVQAFLAPLPVRAINGCGPKTADALADLDIHTVGELAQARRADLEGLLGTHGGWLQQVAQGLDAREVTSSRGPAKSRGNERTFARDEIDATQILAQARHLAKRLLAEKRTSRPFATVTVKLRYRDFTTLTRAHTFPTALAPDAANTDALVGATVEGLLTPCLDGRPIRLVGVTLSGFCEPTGQRPLQAWGLQAPASRPSRPARPGRHSPRFTVLGQFLAGTGTPSLKLGGSTSGSGQNRTGDLRHVKATS